MRPARSVKIALDHDLRREITALAKRRRTSIETTAAELLREALERTEDRALSGLADKRQRGARGAVPHDKAWS